MGPLSHFLLPCTVNIFLNKPSQSNHSSSKCAPFRFIPGLISSCLNVSLEKPRRSIVRYILGHHNSSIGVVLLLIKLSGLLFFNFDIWSLDVMWRWGKFTWTILLPVSLLLYTLPCTEVSGWNFQISDPMFPSSKN